MKSSIATFVCFFVTCGSLAATPNKPLQVVGSIQPVCSIARAVAGEDAVVSCLVPSHMSPHDYALRPSEARLLDKADILFWIGPNLEGFLVSPLKNHSSLLNVTLMTLSDLHLRALRTPCTHHHEKGERHTDPLHTHSSYDSIDPHIWLSLKNASLIAKDMAHHLSSLDPEHAELFKARATAFQKSLMDLEEKVTQRLTPYHDTAYIVFHDAYSYFEEEFELKGGHILRINPELPLSIKELFTIQTTLAEEGITCIFSEPQFNDKFLQPLLMNKTLKHATLDPIGNAGERYETFIENLTNAFIEGLNNSQESPNMANKKNPIDR